MEFVAHDVFGSLGVAFIIVMYFLLQVGKVSATSLSYSLVNALGALFILYSLSVKFNLWAAIIEIFWLMISVLGIYLWFNDNRRKRVETDE
jgi:hypothetical protein